MRRDRQRDLEAHLRSISSELTANKNRIRDLIGATHWLTDGEAKEAIVRRVLSTFMCESMRVGSGFICHPYPSACYHDGRQTSTQIDVLVTDKTQPTLYKAQDLTIVTPDAVKAIAEVKTKLSLVGIRHALKKLADNAQRARSEIETPEKLWVGLFVFEPLTNQTPETHREILELLREVVRGDPNRVINCIAIGEDLFVRFWEDSYDIHCNVFRPLWHSYDLPQLAQGYFLGNLVWSVCPSSPEMQYLWFPMVDGKESRRRLYVGLDGPVMPFL